MYFVVIQHFQVYQYEKMYVLDIPFTATSENTVPSSSLLYDHLESSWVHWEHTTAIKDNIISKYILILKSIYKILYG